LFVGSRELLIDESGGHWFLLFGFFIVTVEIFVGFLYGLGAGKSWKIDLGWSVWYLLDNNVGEESFVRPEEYSLGTDVGSGEELTR
tara:strand:- start:9 stop:266 length:258 start_codon:yes stop_codon:yes gene_type:complete